jgi:DNA-directed RNA polymerase subunit RPC12/RpoP
MAEPRDELGKKLSSYLTPEQISKLIDEVLAIEKRASAEFRCKKCGQRQMIWTKIPDAKSVATALSDLMNQAFGRPSEQNDTVEPVIFKRMTKLEDG